MTKTVFVVMDGNYEPSLDSVFDNEPDAERRAAALREGYCYPVDMNRLSAEDYPYRVDFYSDDETVIAWLDDEAEPHDVEDLGEGCYRVCVRARTGEEAKRIGWVKILLHMGREVSEVPA